MALGTTYTKVGNTYKLALEERLGWPTQGVLKVLYAYIQSMEPLVMHTANMHI